MRKLHGGILALLLVASAGAAGEVDNSMSFMSAMKADIDLGNPAATDFMDGFRNYGLGKLYVGSGALTAPGLMVARSYSGESFAADSMAAQMSFDGFRRSYKHRLGVNRIPGSYGYASAGVASSDAFAMAPSSRANGSYRSQLDCDTFYGGFTVWADGYGTWARQRTRDNVDGYKFSAAGPAVGFDWSNGTFTFGAATTYSWGTVRSMDFDHERDMRTWALAAYGQFNIGKFFVNADAGYGYNHYDSNRTVMIVDKTGQIRSGATWSDYQSDSWNFGAEAGMKFNMGNFSLTPTVGIRYFHDTREQFFEGGAVSALALGRQRTHVLELPVGIAAGYEIHTGGMVFIPEVKFSWVPELDRRNPSTSVTLVNGIGEWEVAGADRSAHGFVLGLGVKARLNRMITAHVNYDMELRPRGAYEHHLNAGIGFSF